MPHRMTTVPLFRLLTLLLATFTLVACGGGPPKRVFPPDVRVQELRLQADGRLDVVLRIQSYSTVATRFEQLALTLAVAEPTPLPVQATPAVDVLPQAAELVTVQVMPGTDARAALDRALQQRRALSYRLDGRITASEPRGRYDVDYRSVLNPAPGLDGVLR